MTELQHQQCVIKWGQQPEIRSKWPELALLYHIPNERYCTPVQGKQLKRAGVRSGVPDLCLPAPRGGYHGLYIEMKTEKGRTSHEQDWWGEHLAARVISGRCVTAGSPLCGYWSGTYPCQEVVMMANFTYPYERAAMRGEEMPDGLDMVDQLNFLCLRSLYGQVHSGTIDRATGSREKGRLIYQRNLWERKLMLQERMVRRSAELFRSVELAANAYAKERTLENADRLYHALYGIEVGK